METQLILTHIQTRGVEELTPIEANGGISLITTQISSESSAGLSSGGQPDYASLYLFPFLPILSPLSLYSWHHIPNSIPANNLCPWLCYGQIAQDIR